MGVAGAAAGAEIVLTGRSRDCWRARCRWRRASTSRCDRGARCSEYQIGLERDELHEYGGGSRGTGADLPGARDAARRGTAREPRAGQERSQRARCIGTRGARRKNPDDLGSPWGAAISSFLAFAVGAVVPLVPFLFGLPLARAVIVAAAVAACALFGVGAMLSLFTGRSALAGGCAWS